MGCAKSKNVAMAAEPEPKAKGESGPGFRPSAKDHLSSQTLPEHPAAAVSGPSGRPRPAGTNPGARLRACIDSHPVVILSKSTCPRCAEVKKLFKSMCVPYFLLELDQAGLPSGFIPRNRHQCNHLNLAWQLLPFFSYLYGKQCEV
ncbi:thioredoxin reductase 1, cytoplasmic-like [Saccopteryx bilineata]|uniref:thioredoxin reductase 1, cytoplasmic-like n=1 Tax=Saccopteryx bilineata TaxID=59482 RepID=UPI00338EC7FD